jgi:cyclase
MTRLIARLDVKNDHVIKGICFEGLRVVGRPQDLAHKYYNLGVDELLILDAVASLYQQNHLGDLLDFVTREVFIPVTAGGAVRTIADAEALLSHGADKVAVNTAAIERPRLVTEIADRYGSQAMVLSVQAKFVSPGKWEAYVNGGRDHTGVDALLWIEEGVSRGAGEVLVTSIDRDGTRKGFDLDLATRVTELVEVPVMFGGGAGSQKHIDNLIQNSKISAAVCGTAFHYDLLTNL